MQSAKFSIKLYKYFFKKFFDHPVIEALDLIITLNPKIFDNMQQYRFP